VSGRIASLIKPHSEVNTLDYWVALWVIVHEGYDFKIFCWLLDHPTLATCNSSEVPTLASDNPCGGFELH